MTRLTLVQARNAWSAAQEIGAGAGSIADVLERTGFVRTLGGIEVYLATRARIPTARAREVDAMVAAGQAQVVPAVRGCIYLVAKKHVPLALRVADLLSARTREREQEKAGIRGGELVELGRGVLDLLGKGPLSTDAIRKGLPAGAVRSLGDAGKKVGVSSPLPAALRLLEFEGKIERTLEGGKVDTERYLWRQAVRNPFDGAKLPDDPIELYARLATIFFRAAGTSTVRVFAEWAGIGLREGQTAVERARLVQVAVDGIDEPSYASAERLDTLAAASGDGVGFLPFEDNLIALHGGPALLVDPQFHAIPVPAWGMSAAGTLGATKHMSTRGIVAEGRLVGLWEVDPATKQTAMAVYDWVAPSTYTRIEALARETSRFISEELGHGRSFTLDSDETLGERAELIRRIARHGVKAQLGDGKMMPGQAAAKKPPVAPAPAKKPAEKAVGKAAGKPAKKPVEKAAAKARTAVAKATSAVKKVATKAAAKAKGKKR